MEPILTDLAFTSANFLALSVFDLASVRLRIIASMRSSASAPLRHSSAPLLSLSTSSPTAPRFDFLVAEDWQRSSASKLRNGQLLLPSGGFANDAARARNSGRRLGPNRTSPRSPPKQMGKSASDSALWGAKTGLGAVPYAVQGVPCGVAPVVEAKTPRTIRGVVRKTSAVQIVFPVGQVPASPAAGVGRWHNLYQSPSATSDSGNTGLSDAAAMILEGSRKDASCRPETGQALRRSSPGPRRVTWADTVDKELGTSSSQPTLSNWGIVKEGTPSPALVKSRKLMDGLYKLRRVGGSETSPRRQPAEPASPPRAAEPDPEAAPSAENDVAEGTNEQTKNEEQAKPEENEEDEEQDTLMNQTLSSLDDTDAELSLLVARLEGMHEPVAELGGARHATTLVSARTLSVVRRKAQLCRASEANLAAFLATDTKREELRAKLVVGEAPVPESYQGVKPMIRALVHKDTDGKRAHPAETSRAPFEVFAASFGLPPEHETLVRLKELAVEATEWWAEETLQEANRGADSFVLQRMINVTIGFLNINHHEKLAQVNIILGNRLAEKVLDIAQRLVTKDAQIVQRSEAAQPEHARKVADQIDEEITEAVGLGAPNKHPMLLEAKQIALRFHMEEKTRWALRALQFAHKKQHEDNDRVAKAGSSVPPVGPASEAADAIEREIATVVNKGAAEEHPHLLEAKTLMKWLRDEDGQRKRMAAREKRLAEAKAKA